MEHEKTITSHANPAIKAIKALNLKKYRDEQGLFLVEGARHVNEAIQAGWQLHTLLFSEKGEESSALITSSAHAVIRTSQDIMSRITGRENAQPVLGVFQQRHAPMSDASKGFWVALEDIRDPGNLGTIIRTCDAAGGSGILLIGNTCDPWSPEAIRASMGSFARIPVLPIAQNDFLSWRKTYAGRVIGTHLSATTDYRKADYKPPCILLMGSEQSGLSDNLSDTCDVLVKIPMRGGAESLNLAIATGIMLYQAVPHDQ